MTVYPNVVISKFLSVQILTPLPFRTTILVLRRFTALRRVNSSSDAASFYVAVWTHLLNREVN